MRYASEWKCAMARGEEAEVAGRPRNVHAASRRSGLPVSTHSARASCSRLVSILSAMASSSRERSAVGVRDQAGKARTAAPTATHRCPGVHPAVPFRPFRLVLNSGKSYDVRRPEMVRVTVSSVLYFYATDPEGPAERWETVSLPLLQSIEHIEALRKINATHQAGSGLAIHLQAAWDNGGKFTIYQPLKHTPAVMLVCRTLPARSALWLRGAVPGVAG